MWKTAEGSTGRLIQLCAAYFSFYVATGVTVKYFTGPAEHGFPGMNDIEFNVYSTAAGIALCVAVVLLARWYRLQSNAAARLGPFSFPREIFYIVPSGVCLAVVIPTTTLMYTLLPSVMVAMVIMRGSIIVISRAVDAVQIGQGILKRKVYWQEDAAVVFALCAVAVNVAWVKPGDFALLHSPAAMVTLGSYLAAYAVRIYIMNFYKNTRAKGGKQDNKGFFAIEQISATIAILVAALLLFNAPTLFGADAHGIRQFRDAFLTPKPQWSGAMLAGTAFGMVAFFSVFLFMFKGRTATFAGLVNRLTSLIAGTAATLLSFVLFGGRFPRLPDWISLGFILVAVAFLTVAERRRTAELAAAHEIDPAPAAIAGVPAPTPKGA